MSRADGERYRRAFRWLLVVDLVLPFASSFVECPLSEDPITIPMPWWLMSGFLMSLGVLHVYAVIAPWNFRRSGRTALVAVTVITFAVPWCTLVRGGAPQPHHAAESS